VTPIQGELQTQIMSVLWRLGSGTVEQVRTALPPRYRSAYTTVQTVLNRLAERGLLARQKRGHAMVYTPTMSEEEYVSRSIERTLAMASSGAREAAIARLLSTIGEDVITKLQRRARELERRRRRA
jgi:predicted transcriptional regulator